MERNDDTEGDRATLDRRSLLKRAAAAGTLAWTAPLVIESVTSPAAAESIIAPVVYASAWGWAKSSVSGGAPADQGITSFTTDVGSATNAGTGQPTAAAGSGAQGSGPLAAATAGQLVVILVGVGDDDNLSTVPTVTGPFGPTTQIQAAANAPFVVSPNLRMYAFWARSTGSGGNVTVTFANRVRSATVIAAIISGGGPPATPAVNPIGVSGSNKGTGANPVFDTDSQAVDVAHRSMVLFGMAQEPFQGMTAGSPGTAGVQWTTVAAPGYNAPVRQVLVTSADGGAGTVSGELQQHSIAMFYGAPPVTSTTATLSAPPAGAFPSVAAEATNQTTGTSHAVTMPSGIVAGELLVAYSTFGGNITPTLVGTAWTQLYNAPGHANDVQGTCYYKVATGGDSLTLSTSSTRRASHIVHRLVNLTGAPVVATAVSVSNGDKAPNSPALTPGFGAVNTLWVSVAHAPTFATTAYPASYTQNQRTSTQTGGTFPASLAVAGRRLNAITEDPGAYTIDTDNRWLATTVAFRTGLTLSWGTFAFEVKGDNF